MNQTEKKYAMQRIRDEFNKLRSKIHTECFSYKRKNLFPTNLSSADIAKLLKDGTITPPTVQDLVEYYTESAKGKYIKPHDINSHLNGMASYRKFSESENKIINEENKKLHDEANIKYNKIIDKVNAAETKMADSIMLGTDAEATIALIAGIGSLTFE